jgi:2-polyprenyl-3-methyl-5-hydroxy-6-metoxy-1,4-benzoquinol methylase
VQEPLSGSAHWDERYAVAYHIYGTTANSYLRSQLHRFSPGARVLAAADGEGRNGVWLAEQGLVVTSVDQSAVALRKAARLAQARGVAVELVCADLAAGPLAGAPYDVIVSIFAHFPSAIRQRIHRAFVAALRPGGLVILEAFHPRQLGRPSGGPQTADMLYDVDLVRDDFAELEVVELLEGIAQFDEGPKHQGEGYVVRFIGRKPTDASAGRGTNPRRGAE